jgi:hypothetical protein
MEAHHVARQGQVRIILLALLISLPAGAKTIPKPEKPFDPASDAPKIVRAWLKKTEGKDHLLAFQDEATGERRRLKLHSLHPGVTTIRFDDLRMWAEFRDHDGAKHKVLLELFLKKDDGGAWTVDHAETFAVDGNPRKPYNEGYATVPPSTVIRRRVKR